MAATKLNWTNQFYS